ncbi:MAG: serine/threonine-protein kinase [Phycisphaerae bacterium]
MAEPSQSNPSNRPGDPPPLVADEHIRAAWRWLRAAPQETPPDASALSHAAPRAGDHSAPAHPKRIGPYTILQPLGEGGMGAVYLAEQSEPIRRRVALKLIKVGMDTREVVARFASERQALALMDHPNIARVFDGGATPDGRPFFVMEYVAGEPITSYCDRHRLTLPERLRLVMEVCHAVQHAHQKGIIHRDLKPSNILVTMQDGRPMPKVIDFGVAKAVTQRLTEQTLFTQIGLFIGTPEYISPEQAEMSQLDIDTRTDIYSLGVLLYELVTGMLPFDTRLLRRSDYVQIQRIVRETEPPRPSARLSALVRNPTGRGTRGGAPAPGAEGPAPAADDRPELSGDDIAGRRRSDARTLLRSIRGDLDWIIVKAMEKDRARRYETASALAAEIQRHLNHEPVLASPPSVGYRARKFVRRNRVAVLAAGLITVSLVAGLCGTTWGVFWAWGERNRAERESKRAQASARFLQRVLGSIDPFQDHARGADLRVREVLDIALRELEHDTTADAQTRADLLQTIGRSYSGLGLNDQADGPLRQAVALRRQVNGPNSVAVVEALLDLAGWPQEVPPTEERLAAANEAAEIARRTLGPSHARTQDAELAAARMLYSHETQTPQSPLDPAATSRGAIDLSGLPIGTRLGMRLAIQSMMLTMDSQEFPPGTAEVVQAVKDAWQRGDEDAAYAALWAHKAATVVKLAALWRGGRRDEAIAYMRGVVKPFLARRLIRSRAALGLVDFADWAALEGGDPDGVEPMLQVTVESIREVYGDKSPHYARALSHLGRMQLMREDLDAAERTLRRAAELTRAKLGAAHRDAVEAQGYLSRVLAARGQADEALHGIQSALDAIRERHGDKHESIALAELSLAQCLATLHRTDDSIAHFEVSRALWLQVRGGDYHAHATIWLEIGRCHANEGRWARAAEAYRKALEARARVLSADAYDVILAKVALGGACVQLGQLDEAQPLLESSNAAIGLRPDFSARLRRACWQSLAALYEARDAAAPGTGYRDRAARLRALIRGADAQGHRVAPSATTSRPGARDAAATGATP